MRQDKTRQDKTRRDEMRSPDFQDFWPLDTRQKHNYTLRFLNLIKICYTWAKITFSYHEAYGITYSEYLRSAGVNMKNMQNETREQGDQENEIFSYLLDRVKLSFTGCPKYRVRNPLPFCWCLQKRSALIGETWEEKDVFGAMGQMKIILFKISCFIGADWCHMH